MIYRRQDSNGDYVLGRNQGNFLSGREAVGLAVKTRLLLLQGEWWENINEGLPLFQNILGVRNNDPGNINGVDLLIQERIINTPNVTGIESYSSVLRQDRTLEIHALVNTTFGTIELDANTVYGQTTLEVII